MEIAPQADSATRTRRARLTLAETPAAFRLGSSISVTLSSAIEPRTRLPLSALLGKRGQTRVWIIDPQSRTVALREVRVLSRDADGVLLASGVKPGERVGECRSEQPETGAESQSR